LGYARADSAIVERVADGLSAAGVKLWLDKMIKAGSNWVDEIERELSAAEFVVFLSHQTRWQMDGPCKRFN
jgi:hypothetical protein